MNIIGITGTGSLIGQAIIKSIKKSSFKDSKLIGMDYFENTIGSYWTDCNYVLPDILDQNISEKQWLEKVLFVIESEKINILFIGVDFELHLFAKYRSLIEEKTLCHIIVSDEKTIEIADDKYLTYEFLKNNNLFFPITYLEDEIENAIENKKISFPMVIKPRNGYRSIDVFVINDEEDLFSKIKKIKHPIIQEYVGTNQTEYTCGVIAFNSEVKKSIVLRRDLKEGNTSTTYLEKESPPIITEYIENISKKLGQYGVCNFQLRIDSKGIPKVFEINARHSGTTYIRSLYGFNEIEYILDYILNNTEREFVIKEGIVKRYYEEFLVEDTK